MEQFVCNQCGHELMLRRGKWQHVGQGCGQESEAVSAAAYLRANPGFGPQGQGSVFATCDRCHRGEPVDATKPYPWGHPHDWAEGIYNPETGRILPWCCPQCMHLIVGPEWRLGLAGEILIRLKDGIDYTCPVCRSLASDPICGGCGGIVAYAIFPLSDTERRALTEIEGLSNVGSQTIERLARRGILTPDSKRITSLGSALRVLLSTNRGGRHEP